MKISFYLSSHIADSEKKVGILRQNLKVWCGKKVLESCLNYPFNFIPLFQVWINSDNL